MSKNSLASVCDREVKPKFAGAGVDATVVIMNNSAFSTAVVFCYPF